MSAQRPRPVRTPSARHRPARSRRSRRRRQPTAGTRRPKPPLRRCPCGRAARRGVRRPGRAPRRTACRSAPGATTLTRTPSSAPIRASERLRPSRPAFADAYAGERAEPSAAPMMLPTSTTLPRPAASAGQAARLACHAAVRSTARISSQRVRSSHGPSGGAPAAQTRPASRPSGPAARATAIARSLSEVASPGDGGRAGGGDLSPGQGQHLPPIRDQALGDGPPDAGGPAGDQAAGPLLVRAHGRHRTRV